MAKFMVRVVLHNNETPKDYERLDLVMQQKGFAQELLGKKSAYRLPCGDYWYTADATAPDVRIIAAAAAEQTGQPFGLIVVRVDGWSVMGLKKSVAPATD